MGWLAAGRSIVHGVSSQSKTSMNGPRKSRWVSVLIDHTSSLLVPMPSFERAYVWLLRGKCSDCRGPSAPVLNAGRHLVSLGMALVVHRACLFAHRPATDHPGRA